ncbi:MAG: hypothetical protein FJY83_07735, partial [Candidatus Aminicenantes bacterium]|nr:hypothetical protein [Candidatus Aminicenantes bacterium]
MNKKVVSLCCGAAAALVLAAASTLPGSGGQVPGTASAVPPNGSFQAFEGGKNYAPDRVLVRFKASLPETLADSLFLSYGTKKIGRLTPIRTYVLELEEGLTVEEAVAALRLNPVVEFAEPDFIARAQVTPNDPLFGYQYALYNSGQTISIPGSPTGKPSADIKAPPAWEETKGDPKVIVAVVDTGVDLLHPDLVKKMSGSGRDFVNGDFDASDDHGHGTFIAGIIGAETDNGLGIAGVAW